MRSCCAPACDLHARTLLHAEIGQLLRQFGDEVAMHVGGSELRGLAPAVSITNHIHHRLRKRKYRH